MVDKKEKLMDIFKTMNQIRNFEETAKALYESGELIGSLHLYVGEEAIAATAMSFLTDEDYIASTHRGHGHGIAKSRDMNSAMAEIMGKETGFNRGRGGSMHIADLDKGNLGANAIVGGGIPIAVGGALARKMQGTDRVSVCFFGDGAANQGTFHEGINLAAVWKLPCIFVCENNGFAISTPSSTSSAVENIGERASAYGIPGIVVDGNDVLALMDAFESAISRARRGEGPTLIECKTYRWYGHWPGDPQMYKDRKVSEDWIKNKCPIKRLREYLVNEGIATEEELDVIAEKTQEEVDEAVAFGRRSPYPDISTVMEDVFCEDSN